MMRFDFAPSAERSLGLKMEALLAGTDSQIETFVTSRVIDLPSARRLLVGILFTLRTLRREREEI